MRRCVRYSSAILEQKLAQFRTNWVRRITRTGFAKQTFAQLRTGFSHRETGRQRHRETHRRSTESFKYVSAATLLSDLTITVGGALISLSLGYTLTKQTPP